MVLSLLFYFLDFPDLLLLNFSSVHLSPLFFVFDFTQLVTMLIKSDVFIDSFTEYIVVMKKSFNLEPYGRITRKNKLENT